MRTSAQYFGLAEQLGPRPGNMSQNG